MATIVISEVIDPIGIERLSTVGEVHYHSDLWNHPDQLFKWAGIADALIVRNQTQVNAELMRAGKNLKVIGRLGVGLDNIDLETARENHIPVVTARGANAVAVAEYVFACLFHFSRNLAAIDQTVRQGIWDRMRGGSELYGKTLGLIGLGDIGQRIAFRAQCFGMRVLAFDPWQISTHMAVMEMGVTLTTMEELLAQSDFISVHVPLTAGTRNVVNRQAFDRMKPGVSLINTSRGGVVDENALLEAVSCGRVAGAALDVRVHEPMTAHDLFRDEPRILLTPHIAGLTAEAGVRTAITVANDVVRVLSGQTPIAAV
ncbi:MAG: hydroxyacid dehydrogenase [Firmicutes bacterium]|nr:hydroxyacid dehydrogenase [Bacillota bacterium]